MELTKEIAIKVKETVEKGLCKGKGKPIPGEMCIEAAVCYAYGLPHNDNPPCVGEAVRAFKIKLNDANWSSNQARAKGMIEISLAQLNSVELYQKEFAKRITIKVINEIISELAGKYNLELREKLKIVIELPEAKKLCLELKTAANAANAAYAAAYAATDAANYAADAAYAATDAATYAATYAADAANYAANYAADAADAADAANYADAADAAAKKAEKRDSILKQAANICLNVLKEMKSEGCKYLYLLDKVID